MQLKHVFISEYKNLKEFSLNLDDDNSVEILIGKNGSGKSNFLEALVEVFHHAISLGEPDQPDLLFDYALTYSIGNRDITLEWKNQKFFINNGRRERKSIGITPTPKNLLIYYSGQNDTISNIVNKYEARFAKNIKNGDVDDVRKLVCVGSDYKSLLLSVLLMQDDTCVAKDYLMSVLDIEHIGIRKVDYSTAGMASYVYTNPILKLTLKRPNYAVDKTDYDVLNQDEENRFWQASGKTCDFLDHLHACITEPEGLTLDNGYQSDDRYIFHISIELLRARLSSYTPLDFFHAFDMLKALGMLDEITVPIALTGNRLASSRDFSDGQFQSVYLYAVTEIFKEVECLTLLDEPDAFLHPEWQFDFLKQVSSISKQAAQTNHIILSTHSASTISSVDEDSINQLRLIDGKVRSSRVKKPEIIKSLSAGLISFTEGEARLNIHHTLKNTTGPVLFTEGITDEMILETAWEKLYPGEDRPFEIQSAFGSGFMRNLMKDEKLYENHPSRTFFSLFDFDEAFNDWAQLGDDIETNPEKCLIKKHKNGNSFAMLLPVPQIDPIKSQVINPDKNQHYGNKSLLTIELLFYGVPGLDDYFDNDISRTDNFIKFVSDYQKVKFAKKVVPGVNAEHFEIFRSIFDFIKTKTGTAQAVA